MVIIFFASGAELRLTIMTGEPSLLILFIAMTVLTRYMRVANQTQK